MPQPIYRLCKRIKNEDHPSSESEISQDEDLPANSGEQSSLQLTSLTTELIIKSEPEDEEEEQFSEIRSCSAAISVKEELNQHHQPARQAFSLGHIAENEVREPKLSPARKIRAIEVECTPEGSFVLCKTPSSSLRKSKKLVRDKVRKRIKALHSPDGEIEPQPLQVNPSQIARWLSEIGCPQPPVTESTLPISGVTSHYESRPSTSGVATYRQSIVHDYDSDGSGFDSDWDDEFEQISVEAPSMIPVGRDIPDDAELDTPVRNIIADVERGMDDEADRLLGTPPNFVWHKDFESFRGVPEQFSGPTPGPLRDYKSAYDAFADIWDEDIIDRIVNETNRYAEQSISQANRTLPGLSSVWDPTNAHEIMVLFAIYQFMAIDRRTSLDEYWKIGVVGMPQFRALMSYKRFIYLNKFLHFVDNNSNPDRNVPQSGVIDSTKGLSRRLSKLAPIIEHLGKKFDSLYRLKPQISINESLTLFKGRLSWVQRIRSTAARFGIKSYELCESHSGYMARFQIYTGNTNKALINSQNSADLGSKSTKAVLKLLQGLERRGHCVTMDNFFNCPSLARYLKRLGFDCLGTFRTSRRYVSKEIPKTPANVPKGTIISRHSGDVSIVSWKDSKMVNIISTFHNADTHVESRDGKSVVKPVCITDYNSYMEGALLKDQNSSMNLLELKRGVKWYMKLFKRLMNISILNSMVMYACCRQWRGQLPVTHREFRYQLAESIILKHKARSSVLVQPVGKHIRLRRDIVHVPSQYTGHNKRRCHMCYTIDDIRKSRYKCVTCDVPLCLECWEDWHSAEDLPKPVRVRHH